MTTHQQCIHPNEYYIKGSDLFYRIGIVEHVCAVESTRWGLKYTLLEHGNSHIVCLGKRQGFAGRTPCPSGPMFLRNIFVVFGFSAIPALPGLAGVEALPPSMQFRQRNDVVVINLTGGDRADSPACTNISWIEEDARRVGRPDAYCRTERS